MAPGAKILYMGAKNCRTRRSSARSGSRRQQTGAIVTDSWGDNGGDLFDIGKEREVFDNCW